MEEKIRDRLEKSSNNGIIIWELGWNETQGLIVLRNVGIKQPVVGESCRKCQKHLV